MAETVTLKPTMPKGAKEPLRQSLRVRVPSTAEEGEHLLLEPTDDPRWNRLGVTTVATYSKVRNGHALVEVIVPGDHDVVVGEMTPCAKFTGKASIPVALAIVHSTLDSLA